MWQNKNSKVFIPGKNKNQSIKILRARGEIKSSTGLGQPTTIIPIKLVLTDFRPKGVEVFAKEPLPLGRDVSITIHGPHQFFSKGRIVAKQEIVPDGKVLRNDHFNFRLGIQFTFDNKEQEAATASFAADINEIMRNLKAPKGAAPAEAAKPAAEADATAATAGATPKTGKAAA